MQLTSYLVSAMLAVSAAAVPTPTSLDKRATKMCDTWGSLQTGGFTIYQNNWGKAQATSGSQCTTFESLKSGSVAWSTSWTWTGGQGQVKSYANVALEKVNKPLSAIKSIPSKWTWTYTGSNMVADVAYDLWLAPSVGANNKYEIMIWLGSYGGAGPISSTGKAIATPTIAGTKWNLFKGPNGDTTVFSFVAPKNIGNFNADLMGFFNYLSSSQGVAKSNVVTSLQAGTEPFSGNNAVLKTSTYTISVK
ncbi:putative xyloglucan-specific endo-beta-1,4-glucanase A 1 [Colletotrichum chlorophyti]|uniref:Putative xyloglucan-specific endo-beta-1,4-glucanase A 1 n=1 Tax=Colletotrichum chlorophyti TaxID=708187 RepID=A0A1Q8S6T3_9PEZI|nr:putative xyloglucan-specific endo-beta-1,4-glucanase A 1 [Colletotrichum chlorophyti]